MQFDGRANHNSVSMDLFFDCSEFAIFIIENSYHFLSKGLMHLFLHRIELYGLLLDTVEFSCRI